MYEKSVNSIKICTKIFCYGIEIFLCPHLPLAGVGHIAFRRDVTSYVRSAYVTFKFTCKFRCKFTSAFLLQLITFIPSVAGLGGSVGCAV